MYLFPGLNVANIIEPYDIHGKHVRSVLEYGAVFWQAGLTQVDKMN